MGTFYFKSFLTFPGQGGDPTMYAEYIANNTHLSYLHVAMIVHNNYCCERQEICPNFFPVHQT